MPKRTGRPWTRTKKRVIKRDGGICHLCGRPGADTADHIVPHSQGGNDHPSNLKAAHHDPCNRLRGDRPIHVAREELRRLGHTGADNGWAW